MRILLIEDEKLTRISIGNMLRKMGDDVTLCETGIEGLEQINKSAWDLVITDLRLPKTNGIDILRQIKTEQPDCAVIVITAYATVETAIEALKIGAYDYLTKPFSPDKLLSTIDHIRQFKKVAEENLQLKQRLHSIESRKVIGNSPVMAKLLKTVSIVAPNDYTILIQGESGTGKELIARTLHNQSRRSDKPFVPINCAVIPETLLESELFGHEKGAFSGAVKRHIGYFERANGGTVFIDDIDDFPYNLQVKLLRVLQERELVRVGGIETIKVDIRVVCATKIDLLKKVKVKEFREDLYYRLNIIPLQLPPLRDRKEDIPVLIEHFLNKRGVENHQLVLNAGNLKKLMNYDWPGNVRELENIVERLLALSQVGVLEDDVFGPMENFEDSGIEQEKRDSYPPLMDFLLQKEQEIIHWALDKCQNNISKAAQLLRVPRSTLRSKIDKLNL